MEYKVEIAGVDYTQYLSLPFNINRKNDSTLMTATLNLVNTKKADKFFQYDEVKITVDNTDLYNFVVATDEIDAVKDAFHTGQFLYNHGVQIIERFKIIEGMNSIIDEAMRSEPVELAFHFKKKISREVAEDIIGQFLKNFVITPHILLNTH